jgi:hypothetical protein
MAAARSGQAGAGGCTSPHTAARGFGELSARRDFGRHRYYVTLLHRTERARSSRCCFAGRRSSGTGPVVKLVGGTGCGPVAYQQALVIPLCSVADQRRVVGNVGGGSVHHLGAGQMESCEPAGVRKDGAPDGGSPVGRLARGLGVPSLTPTTVRVLPGGANVRRRNAADREPRSTSLLRQGERALFVQGSLSLSRQCFGAAYAAAETEGRFEEMAQAALGLGGLWVHERRSAAEAADVEMRQRNSLGLLDSQSAVAMRLRARLAGEADYRHGGHGSVLAAVDEATRADDLVAVAEALSLAHHCMLGPEHATKRLALAGDLLRAGSRTGRRIDVLMGLLWRSVDLFLAGDPHAERSLAELRTALSDPDHLAVGFAALGIDVMLQIRSGGFVEAEALARASVERGVAAGDADAAGWYGAQLVAIRWYQGRSAELIPTLTELVNSPTLSAADNSYFAALAVAAAVAGDRRQAAGALARLRGHHLRGLVRSGSWLVALYGAVEAAHLLDDEHISAEAYSLLRPFSGLPMMGSLAIVCFGSTQHALGVASLTVGKLDRAIGHFQAALQHNQALGHWPAVVLSRHRLGQALTRRGSDGDAAAAAVQLAAAAEEAARLGMALPRVNWGKSLDRSAGAAPKGEPLASPVCRRLGQRWQVQFRGRTAAVADCVGMGYLATLLAHPGREIPAIELAGRADRLPGRPEDRAVNGGGSRQELLDGVAVREYRRRLSELQADIDDYELMNDPERAAQARAERDWLVGQLESAAGLGGRIRHFSDDTERARIAVSKAIHRAIDRLSAADPVIGAELLAGLQTGLRCSFRPQ